MPNHIFDPESFYIVFMDASTSTNITSQQRKNTRRVLLYMGNCAGMISYGVGRGNTYKDAFNDAIKTCERNLICIPLDHYYTNPTILRGKYNNIKFQIFPTPAGSVGGFPQYGNLLTLAGLSHFNFRIIGRNATPYPILYAMFDALSANRTPKMIAESAGQKLYTMAWGLPSRMMDYPIMSRS